MIMQHKMVTEANNLMMALSHHYDSEKEIEFILSTKKSQNMNFRLFYRHVLCVQQQLLNAGLQKGDELVLVTDDVAHFTLLFWGALSAGIIPVPLAFPATETAIEKLFSVWGLLTSPWIVSDKPLDEVLKRYQEKFGVNISNRNLTQIELYQDNDPIKTTFNAASSDDVAFIQFSSGSTGAPKGVMVTHKMLLADCSAIVAANDIEKEDKFFSWLPLSHDFGIIYYMILPVIYGLSFSLMPTRLFARYPVMWLDKMDRSRATVSGAPNYAFEHVMKMFKAESGENWDLSCIKLILNGAEPIDLKICQRFNQVFTDYGLATNAITPAYGLAEGTLVVTSAPVKELVRGYCFDRNQLKIGDLVQEDPKGSYFADNGYPLECVEIRITDDSLTAFADNMVGKIQIKGHSVTKGYYQDPDKIQQYQTTDGWMETGDLGFLRHGRLIVTGRIKDLIIVNGINYYPQDIESICATLPTLGLNKVVACSVYSDNSGDSEKFAVFLLFRQSISEFIALAKDVEELLIRELGIKPDFCLPIRKIPKTTSGKLQRFDLVRQFSENVFNDVINQINNMKRVSGFHPLKRALFSGDEHEALDALCELIQPLSPQLDLQIDQPLMEQGFKSLHITEVMHRINDAVQKNWPVNLLFDFATIKQIANGLIKIVAQEHASEKMTVEKQLKNKDEVNEAAAIIGIGCDFPGNANSATKFWQVLQQQTDLVSEVPKTRWQNDESAQLRHPGLNKGYFINDPWVFDHRFFNITPAEASAMDPQQRLLLQCSWQAFEDAGIDPIKYKGKKVGVFLGLSNIDFDKINQKKPDPDTMNGYAITGSAASIAAGRIAYFYGFNGPVLTLDTACSSSLVAVHQALQSLRSGECDLALAGGANLMLDGTTTAALISMRALSPTGQSKAFSKQADGYGRGEGCGMVLLKRVSDAELNNDKIWAQINGSAINHDGASNGLTAPSGQAQQSLLRSALANASCTAQQIDFIETHGTGTPLGDPIEVAALNNVYQNRDNALLLGSVKSNIGHLEAAAGIAGLIKSALALYYRRLPASLLAEQLNEQVDWNSTELKVAVKTHPLSEGPCYAGVSAFGLSGTNCHVILSSAPVLKKTIRNEAIKLPHHYLTVSAQDQDALHALIKSWHNKVTDQDENLLPELCQSAALQRSHLHYRKRLLADDKASLLDNLKNLEKSEFKVINSDNRVVFIFAGQGFQYPAMAKELYDNVPFFKSTLDQMAEILVNDLPVDLVTLLTTQQSQLILDDTAVTQPLLVAFEVALAKLWQYWGVEPVACIGHSIGELAAAVICESITLEEGLLLAVARGRITAALPKGGAMAAIMSDVATVQSYIDLVDNGEALTIAAHNGPNSVTISGCENKLSLCLAKLTKADIKSRRLLVSHAFHSPLMAAAKTEFSQALSQVEFRQPKYQVISTLSGKKLLPEQWLENNYWLRQLTQPVLFHEAVKELNADERYQCIEISSKPTLISSGRQCCDKANWLTSGSVQKFLLSLNNTLSTLYGAGVDIDWQNYFSGHQIARLNLPFYPFQPHRHEPEVSEHQQIKKQGYTEQPVISEEQPASMTDNGQLKIQLRDLIGGISGLSSDRLDDNANWFSLGLDSLVVVQIQQAILKRFSIDIPYTMLLDELDTLNKLYSQLRESLPEIAVPVPSSPSGSHATSLENSSITHSQPAHTESWKSLFEQQIATMSALFDKQLNVIAGKESTFDGASKDEPVSTNISHAVQKKPVTEIKGLFQSIKTEKSEALAPSQKYHLALLTEQYTAQTKKSKQYVAEHRQHYANSRSIIGFKPETKELTYPVHVTKAQGVHLWDLDGNQYIDITMGFGAVLFGHNPAFIRDAITAELNTGAALGPQSQLPARVAKKLCAMTRTDRAAFFTTGTEAVMVAVRIARMVTERKKIVIFQGAFHGSFDSVLAAGWVENGGPVTVPLTDGTTQGMIDDTIVLKYGDPRSLTLITQYADEIAAVLIEPVQSRDPALQPVEFVKSLRQLTTEQGIALICDDMIIGFRFAQDGCQSWLGIEPDLLTYGKVIGGGQPIGVLAGKKRFMDAVDGGDWQYGDDSVPGSRAAFVAGTYNNHSVAMAAAEAVLDKLSEAGPQLQHRLNQRTEGMCLQLNEWFNQYQLPFSMVWFGSLFRFEFGDKAELLSFHLLKNGLYVWEGRNCFLGTAHTDNDIQNIVAIIKRSIWEMISGGWLENSSCDNQLTDIPLSQGQKAMRFTLLAKPECSAAYSEMMVFQFEHKIDLELLIQAWAILLQRHEILRVIRFNEEKQIVAASINAVIDHAILKDDVEYENTKLKMLNQAFNLESGPFWRLQLVETRNSSQLLMCFSHMIVDGWSMGLLAMELSQVYQCLLQDVPVELPPAISYRQYVAKQCWQGTTGQAINGPEMIESFPLYIAGDQSVYAPRSDTGYRLQHKSWRAIYDKVKDVGQIQSVSPAAILLSAWALLLNRLSQRDDIVVGLPTAGHSQMGAGHLVGYASTVSPLLIDIERDQTVASLLKQTAQALLKVQTDPEHFGNLPISNLFNIDRGMELDFGQLPRWGKVPVNTVKQDLFLNILELNGEAIIDFDIKSDLASPQLASNWLERYLDIVAAICTNPDQTPDQLFKIFAVVPHVVDGQGLPLLAGAIGQSVEQQKLGLIDGQGKWQRLGDIQETIYWQQHQVCTAALTHLLQCENNTDVSFTSHQGCLMLKVNNKEHDLAKLDNAHLVIKLNKAIAAQWQPDYIQLEGDTECRLIKEKRPAENPQEKALAKLWSRELAIELPDIDQSFICLGGTSLKALSVIQCMQSELGMQVSVSDFLRHDSISQLVEFINRNENIDNVSHQLIQQRPDKSSLLISNNQQRLLILQALEPNCAAYNIGFSINLNYCVACESLLNAIEILVLRHQSLACHFKDYQDCVVAPLDVKTLISEVEIQSVEQAQQDEIKQVGQAFKLNEQPAWRVRLQEFSKNSRLVITMHHVISDVWSVEVLTQELLSLLHAHRFGYRTELPPLSIQYSDYVAALQQHQATPSFTSELNDYVDSLQPLPESIDLAPDKPRAAVRSLAGASQYKLLNPDLSAHLYQLSAEQGKSLYVIMMAALGLLVNRQTGANDMILGTVSAQRDNAQLNHQIGFYVNTLAVKLKVKPNTAKATYLNHCAEQINFALSHADLPIDKILTQLALPRSDARQHLLDVVLVMDERQSLNHIATSLDAKVEEIPVATNQFDFTLYVSVDPKGIRLHALYNCDLYSSVKVDCLLSELTDILQEFTDHSIPQVAEQTHYPLTAQQKRLWFVDAFEAGYLYEAGPVYYNMPLQLSFNIHPDLALLQCALDTLVRQQTLLQSKVVTDENGDAELYWQSNDTNSVIPIHHINNNCEAPLKALSEYNLKPFSFTDDYLMRIALASFPDGKAILQLTAHHMVADKSALRRFTKKLLAIYQQLKEQGTSELYQTEFAQTPPEIFFGQLKVTTLHDDDYAMQVKFWRNKLAGFSALQLPEDKRRQAVHIYAGETLNHTLAGIALLAKNLSCDEKSLTLALFQYLLSRYSRQEDIVTGVVNPYKGTDFGLVALDNLVVLRSHILDDMSLKDVVKDVTSNLNLAMENSDVPFDDIVLAINPDNDMSRTALFDVLYIYDEDCISENDDNLVYHEVFDSLGWGKYDLVLAVDKSRNGKNAVSLCFNNTIYNLASMQQLLTNFQVVINSATDEFINGNTPDCGELVLSTRQQRQVIHDNIVNLASYPKEESVVSAFTKVVKNDLHTIALSDQNEALSYQQLDLYSDVLAKQLIAAGVGKETVIALHMDKNIIQPLCILAVLKSGSAYLVLDKKQPLNRLQHVIQDAAVNYLLTDDLEANSSLDITHKLLIGSPLKNITYGSELWQDLPDIILPDIAPEQLAYMIYTSGSTGVPKGVQIEHKNIIQLIKNQQLPFDFKTTDCWTLFHSCAFDFSVWEIFAAWLTGARVHTVPECTAVDSGVFLDLLLTQHVTILNQTPGAFYALLEQLEYRNWPDLPLRMVIFGGEALQPVRLRQFIERYPNIKLINMYGITETTVHVTYKEITLADCEIGHSTIGKPLETYQVVLVDDNLKPTAPGIPGEMLILGHGVSRGYHNRPELNEQVFLNIAGVGKAFRSGDLARSTPTGELIYMGRKDQQVQLRGFRIELGEIEQVIRNHPHIKDVAIKLEHNAKSSHDHLVAWLVPENNQQPLVYEQLLSYLGERLPEYMIPKSYFLLDKIPLNSNGKIDRKSLQKTAITSLQSKHQKDPENKEYSGSFSQLEQQLASIWQDVLEIDQVSPGDNFFEVGGHSLSANAVLLRIKKQLCPAMTLKDFFSTPHLSVQAMLISTLTEQVESVDNTWPEVTKLTDNQLLRPSFAQQRLWLIQQQNRLDTSYNVVGLFDIKSFASTTGKIAEFANIHAGLTYAFKQVINRHDALRTNFELKSGELQLRIHQQSEDFVLIQELDSDTCVAERLQQALKHQFDLENEPLIKACLIKTSGDNNANDVAKLLINMHHIISDGASVTIMMKELAHFYEQYTNPLTEETLAPLQIQYQDYAHWQQDLHRSGALDQQMQYWQTLFADGVPILNLPVDGVREENIDHTGAIKINYLGEQLSTELRLLSKELGITLFMLLSCVTQFMLCRRSGQTDFVIGTPVAGRDDLTLEPLIGLFLNVLPLRFTLRPDTKLKQQILQNSQLITDAFNNQHLAFDQILELLNYQKPAGHHAMFDVQLILQNNAAIPSEFGDISLELQPEQSVSAKFDLNIMFSNDKNIELQLEYATALFNADTAASMAEELISIARQLCEHKEKLETISIDQLIHYEVPASKSQSTQNKLKHNPEINTDFDDNLIEDEEW